MSAGAAPPARTHMSGARRERTRRLALLLAAAFAAAISLLIMFGSSGLPLSASPVRAAMLAVSPTPTNTPTPTPTATATATSTPTPTATSVPLPTLTMVSPSSMQGPAGARVTLSGAQWGSAAVAFGVASSSAGCATPGSWLLNAGAATPAGGAVSKNFVWPTSLGSTSATYFVCANSSVGSAFVGFHVRSASPPVISLSTSVISVSQVATVTGSNFFGVPNVTLTAASAGGARTLATVAPGSDGSFTYNYVAVAGDVGSTTISATSPAEGGAQPALQASASLTITGDATATVADVTPTVAVTPTVPVVATPSGGKKDQGTGAGLLLLLVLVPVLLLLGIVGIIAIFLLRRRGDEAPGQGYGAGMDRDTDPSLYTARRMATGRVFWDNLDDDLPTDEAGPGPDWQPRPMTGKGPVPPSASYPASRFDDDDPYRTTDDWSPNPAPSENRPTSNARVSKNLPDLPPLDDE